MSTKNLIISVIMFCALIIGVYYVAQDNKATDNLSGASVINNSNKPSQNTFSGEKGDSISLTENKVQIPESEFEGINANFYNTKLSSGTTVYYFVVRDAEGIFRAAANACQVCFDDKKGFHQEGDYMVCNTCRRKYPLSKIATEKGGCNPGPINPSLEVVNGNVIINEADLNEVIFFF